MVIIITVALCDFCFFCLCKLNILVLWNHGETKNSVAALQQDKNIKISNECCAFANSAF